MNPMVLDLPVALDGETAAEYLERLKDIPDGGAKPGPLPDHALVERTTKPKSLRQAIADELVWLWGDLATARRNAHNGCWSVGCENTVTRIVALSRMVGATPWGHIDVGVLLDGLYERVHREAGIEYPPIDWVRVREIQAYIDESVAGIGRRR